MFPAVVPLSMEPSPRPTQPICIGCHKGMSSSAITKAWFHKSRGQGGSGGIFYRFLEDEPNKNICRMNTHPYEHETCNAPNIGSMTTTMQDDTPPYRCLAVHFYLVRHGMSRGNIYHGYGKNATPSPGKVRSHKRVSNPPSDIISPRVPLPWNLRGW